MNTTTTTWLPRPPQNKRLERFRTFIQKPALVPIARFSEFLTPGNICLFQGQPNKIEVIETLVRTLHGQDHNAALQAIWSREREGTLGIRPDVSIMRGRLEHTHHIRAALGICPEGVFDPSNPDGLTRLFVVFVGPTTQTRLHTAFLVAASALFHNRRLVEQLVRMKSPENVLQALHVAEGTEHRQNPLKRAIEPISHFFRMYFAWNRAETP